MEAIEVKTTITGFLGPIDGDQGRTLFIANHTTKQRGEVWHDVNMEHEYPDGWEVVGQKMAISPDPSTHPNPDYEEVVVHEREIEVDPDTEFRFPVLVEQPPQKRTFPNL